MFRGIAIATIDGVWYEMMINSLHVYILRQPRTIFVGHMRHQRQ